MKFLNKTRTIKTSSRILKLCKCDLSITGLFVVFSSSLSPLWGFSQWTGATNSSPPSFVLTFIHPLSLLRSALQSSVLPLPSWVFTLLLHPSHLPASQSVTRPALCPSVRGGIFRQTHVTSTEAWNYLCTPYGPLKDAPLLKNATQILALKKGWSTQAEMNTMLIIGL